MPIQVACPACEERYTAPDQLAGREVTCQACGQAMQIPAATPEPQHPDALQSEAGRVAAIFEEEFGSQGVPGGRADAGPVCPSCGNAVAAAAVLCVECGYDFRKGKVIQVKTARRAAGGETANAYVSPATGGASTRQTGPVQVPGAGLNVVRVGLAVRFWSLVATFTVLSAMFALMILSALQVALRRGSPGLGPLLVLGIVLLVIGLANFVGCILCLWVPRASGAKGTIIGVVVLDTLHITSPLWMWFVYRATAQDVQQANVMGTIVHIGVNFLPLITSILFLLFLRSLALYVRRTDLSAVVDSIMGILITTVALMLVIPVGLALVVPALPPPVYLVLVIVSAVVVLVCAVRMLIAIYQYALVLWRLKAELIRLT